MSNARTRSVRDISIRSVKIANCIVTASDDGFFWRVTPKMWFKKGAINHVVTKTWGTHRLDNRVIHLLVTEKIKLHQLDYLSLEQVEESFNSR